MPRTYYPFYHRMDGQRVLLIGGGQIALQKARALYAHGADLAVISREYVPEWEVEFPLGMQRVSRSLKPFDMTQLHDGFDFVVSATADRELNERLYAECRRRHLPLNCVDEPQHCTFIFPAILEREPLTVAISTAGTSPSAASWLKSAIARTIPSSLPAIMSDLGRRRQQMRDIVSPAHLRWRVNSAMFYTALSKDRPLSDAEAEQVIAHVTSASSEQRYQDVQAPQVAYEPASPASQRDDRQTLQQTQQNSQLLAQLNASGEGAASVGIVHEVGAGCGGPELLTVRAYKLIEQAQVLVYDALIDPAIVELAPPSCERIYCGKRGGKRSVTQDQINELLLDLARQGKNVVRLKGGDPLVFGRGGEEILYLRERGVQVDLTPGISSALWIPAEAGVPLTHRDVARGFHVLTAHAHDGLPDFDWDALAHADETLVFLMVVKNLSVITEELLAAGMDPATPAAALSGGNSAHPLRLRSTLHELAECAQRTGLTSPAVVVIGESAGIDLWGA
ncbi:MAG: uroporphyrinogen-III C-methyltransferase [Actinomycetaceae bacterium]|nr:uroporphyrinogen-III C-methyltransferase [Actinomycetaceae bacterium]MDY5855185.1 uroporphyrinogen-III C-methyltransferase [Arcanobacterium sp.]